MRTTSFHSGAATKYLGNNPRSTSGYPKKQGLSLSVSCGTRKLFTMPPLPFHLSAILRPLSPSLATVRLKSNVFALVLFSLRNLFPPFRAVRSLVLQACDAAQGRVGREKSFGEVGLGLGGGLKHGFYYTRSS